MRLIAVPFALAFSLPVTSSVVQAQSRIAVAERKLASQEWQTRARGFAAIDRNPANWEDARLARLLLETVRHEDEVQKEVLRSSNGVLGVVDKFGEEYGEYVAQALEECLRFCDHESILSIILADATQGPTRRSAVELLGTAYERVSFSEDQRARMRTAMIAATTDASSYLTRSSALSALGQTIRSSHAMPPSERERVHRAVLAAVSDRTPDVRVAAIRRIGELADPGDKPLLSRLATEDQARDSTSKDAAFPVRDAARRAIEKIQGSRPPN